MGDKASNKEGGDGVWLCKVEEMRRSASQQIGQSACGPTALLNVLKGCGVKRIPSPEVALRTTPARQRNYATRSLREYLESRALAGTIHTDLLEGVSKLSNSEVTGQMFAVDPFATAAGLSDWLSSWISMGAVPLVTLNLFLDGHDAFHHQTIFGVEDNGDMWASNPVMKYKAGHLLSLLTGGAHMVIPKEHILWRFQDACREGTAQAFLAEVEELGKEEPWRSWGVAAQISKLLGNMAEARQSAEAESKTKSFGDLVIPWGGLPGVIIFAKTGSRASEELRNLPEEHVNVELPLYGLTERIPVALQQRLEDDEKRTQMATLAAQVALLQEEARTTKTLLARESEARGELEQHLQEEQEESAKVADEAREAYKLSEELTSRLDASVEETASLRLQVEALGEEKITLAQELASMAEEMAGMQARITELEEDKQELNTALEESSASSEQLRGELQAQCQDTSSLAGEMAYLVKEFKAQTQVAAESNRQVEDLQYELSMLKAQQRGERAEALNERKVLLAQLEELKKQMRR